MINKVKLSEVTTAEETAVLLKYGTKQKAIFAWWGRRSRPEDEWELWVCRKWQQEALHHAATERQL
jgi:hypothetical protein